MTYGSALPRRPERQEKHAARNNRACANVVSASDPHNVRTPRHPANGSAERNRQNLRDAPHRERHQKYYIPLMGWGQRPVRTTKRSETPESSRKARNVRDYSTVGSSSSVPWSHLSVKNPSNGDDPPQIPRISDRICANPQINSCTTSARPGARFDIRTMCFTEPSFDAMRILCPTDITGNYLPICKEFTLSATRCQVQNNLTSRFAVCVPLKTGQIPNAGCQGNNAFGKAALYPRQAGRSR